MGNRSNRQGRKILKGVGYAVVGVTAVILLALLIRGTRKPSDSVHTGGEGRIGDVWIGDACYEKRRDLKNILFIAVENDGDSRGIHSLAVHPQAAYLAILSIDEARGTYFLTTLDTRLHTAVEPVNEFGEVEENAQTSIADANLGLAQAFGDGGRRSCMNTTRTVEKLLNVIITNQVCIRLSDTTEKPMFLTDPRGQLQEINRSVQELMDANIQKSFAVAMSESCVYTDFRDKSSFERILNQVLTYTSAGSYELEASSTAEDATRLAIRLFLTELPNPVTRKEGTP